jgi:hypothetical protein
MNKYNFAELNLKTHRILPIVPLDHILGKNGNMFFDLYSLRGYDPLVDKKYIKYISGIETNKFDVHPNTVLSKPNLNSQILNLLDLRYILTENTLDNSYSNIEFLKKYKDLYIYENKNNIGYAKVYNNILIEQDIEKTYELLKNNVIDVRKTLIINEKLESLPELKTFKAVNIIKNIEHKFGNTVISGINIGEGFLFLSEKFSNINTVLYNNQPVKKYLCNYMFTAVKLKQGEFKIEIIPYNNSYIIFAIFSGIFAIIFVMIINFDFFKINIDFFNKVKYNFKK